MKTRFIISALALGLSMQAETVETLSKKYEALSETLATLQESQGQSSLDKVSVGGYGKVDYTNFLDDKSEGKDKIDLYRAIIYLGYAYSEDVHFVSEIELEHGGVVDGKGEVIVEQAYLDFHVNDYANIKLGHFIVPVGYVNLYHEPIAFNGVNRPEVEKYIIPSTWHENGVLVYGSKDGFSYKVGLVASLDAGKSTEVRGMRQSGIKSKAEDFAFVGRLDYDGFPGLNVGASVFSGGASQADVALDGVSATIVEGHVGYKYHDISLRALYATATIDDAQKVALKHEKGASGESHGYYINLAYRLNEQFTPFVRYESYDRFDEKFDASGVEVASGKDVINTVVGLNYTPVENVVIKIDYMKQDDKGVDDDRIEIGTGYVF